MSLYAHFNFYVVIVLMMTGFYIIMARNNLVKKVIGLNIFQASVILLYVSMAKVEGGTAAILVGGVGGGHGGDGHGDGGHGGEALSHGAEGHAAEAAGHAAEAAGHGADAAMLAAEVVYSNPLPHVLMLTAIVVGVATTALGLALVVRIQEAYGTIEEDEIQAIDDAEDGA